MGELWSALTWTDAVGTFGTLIVLGAYLATQLAYLNSDDLLFPLANVIGAALIAFSLIYTFNLASALMEVFWIAISIVGIIRYRRNKRSTASPHISG